MTFLERIALHIPKLRTLLQENRTLRQQIMQGFPPGHFHSPIPSVNDIREREDKLWATPAETLPGIRLRIEAQLTLLDELSRLSEGLPAQGEGTRYHIKNNSYPYGGAVLLSSMIRKLTPKRIIEVGSGHTSCVMMDTNEILFNNAIDITFVEPFPKLLQSLMKPSDVSRYRLIDKRLQDVPVSEFQSLGENDVLFIDSTHVSKIGSDVNHILFEILPSLRPGVHIHFHDICYPFEYPKVWVYQGWYWNEAYLLRAFLEYNQQFEIVFWNDYLSRFHPEMFQMLHHGREQADGSLWIKKL